MTIEPKESQTTRRDFLKGMAALLLTAEVGLGLNDQPQETTQTSLKLSPDQMGVNLSPKRINWLGLNFRQTINDILALPFGNVRIAVPFDVAYGYNGKADYSTIDFCINEAIKKGKRIALQMGVKTIWWPEVHVPKDLEEKFPYLKHPGQIDTDPEFRDLVFKLLTDVSERFLPIREITSIQVENEAFSQRLPLTNYRYVSPEFNLQEVQMVRSLDPYRRPILQNIPFDTPELILHVIENSDILGINIYNQADKAMPPWSVIQALASLCRVFGKGVKVPELQMFPWTDNKMGAVYPYEAGKAQRGLIETYGLKPETVYIWDVEQYFWRKVSGISEPILPDLENLAEAA